jgi:hypothetical protein
MKREEFKNLRKAFAGKTIEELVSLLSSDDLPTRFFAEMSLRDATGV